MAKAGQMDLLFANSIVYIQLKRDMPVIAPLALAAEAKAGTRFRGIIITRKDSGIEKLQDLKGKSSSSWTRTRPQGTSSRCSS